MQYLKLFAKNVSPDGKNRKDTVSRDIYPAWAKMMLVFLLIPTVLV
jgi:hypothetical protein